jgi:formylglycine-generating enzyme required for sulfatase activity
MPRIKEKWREDEREIAELIWCAAHLHHIITPSTVQEESVTPDRGEFQGKEPEKDTLPTPEDKDSRIPLATKSSNREEVKFSETHGQKLPSTSKASTVGVTTPFPLPKAGDISKALLPLARRIPGRLNDELDIDATVEQTAEANGLIIPILRAPLERCLEIHLLIDNSPSMEFWGDLGEAVASLFRWQGCFRDVRVWKFVTKENEPQLLSGLNERDINSLISPGGHRLFIVLTDTMGKAWRSGKAFAVLSTLGEKHSVTLAHIFPQSLWERTVLERAITRPLIADGSECPNSKLEVGAKLRTPRESLYLFPIFNLSANHFQTWASFIAGNLGNSIQGVLIRKEEPSEKEEINTENEPKDPKELLQEFQINASPEALELAKVLAAVPLIPPVMRLAQSRFLPDSQHWHLAEVFFSGLIKRWSPENREDVAVLDDWYDFHTGIRDLLLGDSPVQRTTEIWRGIGDFIESNYGSFRDLQALIANPNGSTDMDWGRYCYFAEVNAAIFRTWGGEYASLAAQLTKTISQKRKQPLPIFTAKTVYVDIRGEIVNRETINVPYYDELLTGEIEPIRMMAIPQGEFWMGSPESEKGHNSRESPQHLVKVPGFFMSQTPITQAQWRAIASLPQEGKELELAPSGLKGDDLPVERVNWYDAREFCARLSRLTERDYRLPSEAQWEYACRAIPNPVPKKPNQKHVYPPFHFGETLTSNLANYRAKEIYQQEAKGEYRGKTTPVRSFSPNAFGLYDMHGNVWEWCEDDWHDDYKGAPTDGSAWTETGKKAQKSPKSVLRGGSWDNNPVYCRSACRYNYVGRGNRDYDLGFRVLCVVGRTH